MSLIQISDDLYLDPNTIIAMRVDSNNNVIFDTTHSAWTTEQVSQTAAEQFMHDIAKKINDAQKAGE